MREPVAVAYSDEPLRVIVFRMAESGVTRVPFSRGPERKLLGMMSLDDYSVPERECSPRNGTANG